MRRHAGALVADGTLTRFEAGKVTTSRPFVHMLLVLGFDVYRQRSTRRSSIPGSSPRDIGSSEGAGYGAACLRQTSRISSTPSVGIIPDSSFSFFCDSNPTLMMTRLYHHMARLR